MNEKKQKQDEFGSVGQYNIYFSDKKIFRDTDER